MRITFSGRKDPNADARKLAEQRAREAAAMAAQQQATLNAIAAERVRTSQQQQADLARLMAAQERASAAQKATVDSLRVQERQQADAIAAARLVTQAAASSLRILAPGMQSLMAPSAAVTRPAPARRGARSTPASLRIGGTSQARGAGLNIGG